MEPNITQDQESLKARVKGFYDIIAQRRLGDDPESLERRLWIVRELERLMKTEFADTADLEFKVSTFIREGRAWSGGQRLKKARQKMGWGQNELAFELGCGRDLVSMMERDERQLNERAVFLLDLAFSPVFNKALIIKQLREERNLQVG